MIRSRLFPWPIPRIDLRNGKTMFSPRCGKLTRSFPSMAQAMDYETGVAAFQSGCIGLVDDASSATRLGYCDARQMKLEADATPITFGQYLQNRKEQKTFEQMIDGVMQ